MQPNFNPRKTSSLIRQTEAAKKKAHRRLIGSIFMLLIALIVLLNVTARVKPIAVTPKIISINGNTQNNAASAPIHAKIASTAVASVNINNASSTITAFKPTNSVKVTSSGTTATSTPESNAGFKAQIINNQTIHNKITPTQEAVVSESVPQLPHFKAQVITETTTNKPSPEDILNGDITTQTTKRYYVQIFASKERAKLVKIQEALSKRNIKTIIQSIQTPNGTIYRLRTGPFNTTTLANNQLNKINNINN